MDGKEIADKRRNLDNLRRKRKEEKKRMLIIDFPHPLSSPSSNLKPLHFFFLFFFFISQLSFCTCIIYVLEEGNILISFFSSRDERSAKKAEEKAENGQ